MHGISRCLPPYPCAEMGLGFEVGTIDITTSDTAGEEGSVSVLDDLGEAVGPFDGLIAQDLLVAVDGAVHARPLGGVALNHAVAHHQIGADDDADIGGFQPLAGMDATDLVDGIRADNPGGPVFGQVPLHPKAKFGQDDVHGLGVFFAFPVPAIAGHQAGFVVLPVAIANQVQ